MSKANINYIKRLQAFKATHNAALRSAECVLDLRKFGGADASEIAKIEAHIAERKAVIETLAAQIAAAKAA